MLKVLVPITYSELGGSQVFLLKLIDALSKEQDVKFTCWLFQDGPLVNELEKRNIQFCKIGFSMRNPFFLRHMIGALKKENPDIIYLHASRFIALAAKLAKIPCVERINMSRNTQAGGWCKYSLIDRLFTSFNTKALAVSEAIRKQLLERGIPRQKICVIRNFVELDRFHKLEESLRKKIREELGLSEDTVAVLNVGRFMPQKGQSDFLKIASQVVPHYPKLKFILLGEGELKEQLLQETKQLNLEGHVIFLSSRKDVEKIYGAADILLHTAHWDPLANVLLEGMATSLPVIATDVDGTSEAIRDHETGRLFPKGDVNKGSAILMELMENHIVREELGKKARLYIEEKHSPALVLAQYKELFSKPGDFNNA